MMRQRSFRSQSQETFRRDKKGQRARRRERHNAQSTTQGSEALFTQQQMRRADRESKKGKEQALAMAKLKMKSWVEILKATWTAWTPVTHNFTKLKGAIESKRLPQLNEEETEMLMQTIRTTAVSTPWCLDLDMLMGLILVLGAETFEAIWKEFALELNAWLRGEEIRQMTRKIELRERLELQGPLLEEVTKWKERKERRERKEGVPPLTLPNSTFSPPSPILLNDAKKTPMEEDEQKEEVVEQKSQEATPESLEDETMSLVRGGVGGDITQRSPSMGIPSPMTPHNASPMMTPRSPPKETHKDEPVKNVPKSLSVFEERRNKLVDEMVELLSVSHGSLFIEAVHALLLTKNLTAKVYEPWLYVKDDKTADIRAALWPQFRHIDAGNRDEVINASVEECGPEPTKKLFKDALKRLNKWRPSEPKKDTESWLELQQMYEYIGKKTSTKPPLNIIQQCIHSTSIELHFEFVIFDGNRPLMHKKVEANGDCWIATVLRQCESEHMRAKWQDDGAPYAKYRQKLDEEIAKEKRHLKQRVKYDHSLITSFYDDIVFVGECQGEVKQSKYPVKKYSLQESYVLFERFQSKAKRL